MPRSKTGNQAESRTATSSPVLAPGLAGAPSGPHPPSDSGPALRKPPPPRPAAPLRFFLAAPLFLKILLANVAIVGAAILAATIVTARWRDARPGEPILDLLLVVLAAGLLLSILVNVLLLRTALSPLRDLENTARDVQEGNLEARAPLSALADREVERVIRTFNAMLDGLAANRQRLRDVAARALAASEEERKRIARELHDDAVQRIAAVLIRLRLVQRAAEGVGDAPEEGVALSELRDELAATLEDIRRYIRGLRPPALDELGVHAALEAHAHSVSEATGLPVDTELEPLGSALPPEAELALFRMVQEALTNVVRHAAATRATVSLRLLQDAVVAVVEDNGRGFSADLAEQGEGRGLGLFGMQERAAYVGGEVVVRSQPGVGTRVRIRIPLGGALQESERGGAAGGAAGTPAGSPRS